MLQVMRTSSLRRTVRLPAKAPAQKQPASRELDLSFRVRANLYPGELGEAVLRALHDAGLEAIILSVDFANPKEDKGGL